MLIFALDQLCQENHLGLCLVCLALQNGILSIVFLITIASFQEYLSLGAGSAHRHTVTVRHRVSEMSQMSQTSDSWSRAVAKQTVSPGAPRLGRAAARARATAPGGMRNALRC